MHGNFDLLLRQVRIGADGPVDVGLRAGRIAAIAAHLDGAAAELDGGGGALIPGLIDHHIHLLATAAQRNSVDLRGLTGARAVHAALVAAAAARPPGQWLRATGYDECAAGLPDCVQLDAWVPAHPLRIQDRTGALWLLNSAGLAALGPGPFPDAVERDAAGVPSGRIWRGDAWLRERLEAPLPDLAGLGRTLAGWGVTGLTDAGASNGPAEAALFAAAYADGALPQRLLLMGNESLPHQTGVTRGPLKLLFDDRDLPGIADVVARIRAARSQRRAVAAHCVTVAELVTFLSALDDAGGAQPGDRVEHGSLIPADLIPAIARARLTVVTQPGFVAARGDRYRAEVDAADLPDLYRLRSLRTAGVALAAGSDAPYGPADPWAALRSAVRRTTASGAALGTDEALSPAAALRLWLGSFTRPGTPRRLRVGAVADLCLLAGPLAPILARVVAEPGFNPVRATLVDGQIIHKGVAELTNRQF